MDILDEPEVDSKQWWANKRLKYNIGLIIAGWSAFALYAFLGSWLIAPHDDEFEITLFTTLFQGLGYLFMMGIANLFYGLGNYVDREFNKTNNERFRKRLYNLGFWFSVALPFSVPALIVIQYLLVYQ